MTSIPMDLILDILSRLPEKSIARFLCVSKLWGSMLRGPYFTELFLTRSLARPRLLFAVVEYGEWSFFSSPQPQNPYGKSSLVVAADFHMKFSKGRNPYTSSYANGLIYFSSMRISKEEKYDDVHMICNPSTGQYVILPELRSYRQAGSFLGFDPIDKQFKVLVMACVYDDHHILTLGTGKMSWRKIQCPLSHERLGEAKCFNGAVFYLARKTDDWSCGIVCFDVRSEKFMFIDAKHFGVSLHTQLINYKGKLGGISLKYACDGGFPLELCMWVLEDVEKRKWLKYVYTLQADNNLVKVKNNLFVVGTTATGEIVLSKDKGSIIINTIKPFYVFYFNPEKNTLLSVEIQDLGNAMDTGTGHGWFNGYRVYAFADDVEDLKFNIMNTTCAPASISPPEQKRKVTSTSTSSTKDH
ncbi:putative F-box protein At5g42430 [Arabidopsis lyrata subsp. lyrata]|uniref:putative F-box protein At5g42430 n=1 Tax=Arabidopsis lyrata subsp. lyrata TaxID=81972 RepID=UPI000A29CFBA|nr:putative F-box protein At5g42430 [Arabidopsis lyrata subsp. lyrata]|eukprot:XP_020883506.1 putative F-box protein At5g42430 [Arabidopsis lyrata subsp. lyrata]